MSAFEIKFTPPGRAKCNRQNSDSDKYEPIDVVMAPFSRKSVVQFEDVPVEKTAKRILRISNPTSRDLKVILDSAINPQLNLSLEWSEMVIPCGDFVSNELVWSPHEDMSCKEDLKFTDDRNFSKIVSVILKTANKKQHSKNVRKFPTVTLSAPASRVKNLRLKTPTASVNKLNRSLHTTPKRSEVGAKQQKNKEKATKEIKIQQTSPLIERNIVKRGDIYWDLPLNTKSQARKSAMNTEIKENVSPLPMSSVLDIIDEFQFTPISSTTNKTNKYGLDEYSMEQRLITSPTQSLNCTPISSTTYTITNGLTAFKDNVDSIKGTIIKEDAYRGSGGLKPKSLNDTLMHETITITVTDHEATYTLNKTNINTDNNLKNNLFDNKSMGNLKADPLTEDNLECYSNLNITPTSKYLDVIEEEEQCIQQIKDKKCETQKAKIDNLKRDVKLVGKPLRKYSESMKDLLIKSPKSNRAGQGSLPNLNEMDIIKDFENNRYLKESDEGKKLSSGNKVLTYIKEGKNDQQFDEDVDGVNFGCDILAQSSVVNLNEIDMKKTTKNERELTTYFRRPVTPKQHQEYRQKAMLSEQNLHQLENDSIKRRLHELSFSDTQSIDSISSSSVNSSNQNLSVRSNSRKEKMMFISPPKRQRLDGFGASNDCKTNMTNNLNSSNKQQWLKKQPKRFKTLQTLKLVKPRTSLPSSLSTMTKSTASHRRSILEEQQRSPIKLYDTELYLQSCINPDPFAPTTTCDPFLASTMYLNDRAVEKHEIDFKKWLNALVAIPADLDTNKITNTKIDVAKLFNDARNKELTLPPTKEQQSINYLTTFRLESLRRAAVQYFMSDEMRVICSKVAVYIQKGSIRIRNDRNLHLDVVTQRDVLELLLNFNPLWLRLGLEVVYGEKIYLQSNCDVIGLSTFILNRLFRDKYLEQKNSRAYPLSAKYAEYIKKFTLQKIIFLLLFLDKAKQKRIITHNPCLFIKKSPFKETREILLRFSSELLANVGDITRELGRLGYLLTHKQTYLDEFDYAFNNLGVDLRDGVRLTRVMEIILLRDDLTSKVRVPAISRLQRIYNVNIALKALKDADFQLKGEIVAQDIVDGHREKTLSLLWQIIYKFRSPKFHAAARCIQKWWHNKCWLLIVIRRRIREKEIKRQNSAALRIQTIYRGYIGRKFAMEYCRSRLKATIVVQKYARGYLARRRTNMIIKNIKMIQDWYRNITLSRQIQRDYLQLRRSVCLVQEIWRRRQNARQLRRKALQEKEMWLKKKLDSAILIQSLWRGYKVHRVFKQKRKAAIIIQKRYKGYREMCSQRANYCEIKQLIIKLQRRYRATKAMQICRKSYEEKRRNIITLQRRYRAYLLGCRERQQYSQIRNKICYIQQKWRAKIHSRKICLDYEKLKYNTICIQRRYRSNRLMKLERANYQQLRCAVIFIQNLYRSKLQMRSEHLLFVRKLKAVLTIQKYFKAYKMMRYQRAKYRGLKNAVECIQIKWRECILMRRQRSEFQCLRNVALWMQAKFRGKLQMRKEREHFIRLRKYTIYVQRLYRAKQEMLKQLIIYKRQRELIILLQKRWKNILWQRKQRKQFQCQRNRIIFVQQKYRAKLSMRFEQQKYQDFRSKVIYLQKTLRMHLEVQRARSDFQRKRKAVIQIQNLYRSIKQMHRERGRYLELRRVCILMQRRWRANCLAKRDRRLYLENVKHIIYIQRLVRGKQLMRIERTNYQKKRNAAIKIQRYYRERYIMLNTREQYLLIRTLVMVIQQRFRAKRQMLQIRNDYLRLRNAAIFIQRKYRAYKEMCAVRQCYRFICKDIVMIQSHARGLLARKRFQSLMTPEMKNLIRYRKAAQIIQRYWRGYRIRKRFSTTKMQQIRKNIVQLKENKNVFNTIRFKVYDAVRILRGRSSASDAINVLKRLDRISRTVPHLLIQNADFIATFCYGIMAQAIRSEIDKHLIMYCCRIILNLARYSSTTVHAFQQGGLVTIAQILLRWCDKDCEIFNTLCTLVWVFAHCPIKCKVIREFMTTSEALYMVRETSKLVARKEKMKQNVRKPSASNHIGSNFIGNHTINNATQNFPIRSLPTLEPDFGVIHKKPYTFISSVFAFNTLLIKLGISIY